MKNIRVHNKPESLFNQCDYRWIMELSLRKGRYVSGCKSILH